MYKVQKITLLTIEGEELERYHLLKNNIPMFRVNGYLDSAGRNSINTGKQYAYRLRKYFDFLESRGRTYTKATVKDILRFVDSLLFDTGNAFYIGSGRVTYNTIGHYLTVIKEFYKYLEDEADIDIKVHVKREKKSGNRSYLYGQIWSIEISKILEKRITRTKSTREYDKWYTEEEKEALLSNFRTLRDRAVFLLTLEGLRIDEVLSLREIDYDPMTQEASLYQSKGKQKGNVGASVLLSSKTVKAIDDYLYNERDVVLMLLQEKKTEWVFPEKLFINLRDDAYLGKPLTYRNFEKILKRVGGKAGMDPSRIITHSGRSTKTMELLHHQVEHPEDNITDEHIRQLMRWSNANSIKPYINQHDKRLAIESAKKIHKRKKEGMKDGQQD